YQKAAKQLYKNAAALAKALKATGLTKQGTVVLVLQSPTAEPFARQLACCPGSQVRQKKSINR
ncbi:hypothetical protein AAVH_30620, partial [Aphelenchoides avenae]